MLPIVTNWMTTFCYWFNPYNGSFRSNCMRTINHMLTDGGQCQHIPVLCGDENLSFTTIVAAETSWRTSWAMSPPSRPVCEISKLERLTFWGSKSTLASVALPTNRWHNCCKSLTTLDKSWICTPRNSACLFLPSVKSCCSLYLYRRMTCEPVYCSKRNIKSTSCQCHLSKPSAWLMSTWTMQNGSSKQSQIAILQQIATKTCQHVMCESLPLVSISDV